MARKPAPPGGSNRRSDNPRIDELARRRQRLDPHSGAINENHAASRSWQLQVAKARFSELVKRALQEGPQHVSVRGEPAVAVISEQEFAKLTAQRPSIVDHILDGPPWPDDVVDAINQRSRDSGRDVEF